MGAIGAINWMLSAACAPWLRMNRRAGMTAATNNSNALQWARRSGIKTVIVQLGNQFCPSPGQCMTAEHIEIDRLDRQSREAIKQEFSRPVLNPDELEAVRGVITPDLLDDLLDGRSFKKP